jgi:fatty-acyl-CoA synthase
MIPARRLLLRSLVWRAAEVAPTDGVHSTPPDDVCTLSWTTLEERSRRLASALRRSGVGAGDPVATLAFNDHRHLEAYLAIPCLGAILHPVNVR